VANFAYLAPLRLLFPQDKLVRHIYINTVCDTMRGLFHTNFRLVRAFCKSFPSPCPCRFMQ
jgi:hypothetical protein